MLRVAPVLLHMGVGFKKDFVAEVVSWHWSSLHPDNEMEMRVRNVMMQRRGMCIRVALCHPQLVWHSLHSLQSIA